MPQRVNGALFPYYIPSNMLVTCFYATLKPESDSVSYANTGLDLPYLHRSKGEAEHLRAT